MKRNLIWENIVDTYKLSQNELSMVYDEFEELSSTPAHQIFHKINLDLTDTSVTIYGKDNDDYNLYAHYSETDEFDNN